MGCFFDTKEKYIVFLEKLLLYCDSVAILSEDDLPIEVIDSIMGHKSEIKAVKEFPGYDSFRKKIEIPFFTLNRKVSSALKEYDSFLEVGYNRETGLGFDMAFYREGELVFLVIRHEEMCDLETDHEPYFREIIRKYKLDHEVL